ncbi:PDZ/DHR/GLGF domain-containing protein [Desulfatibacillum aliphaticivorans]|uniref:PDZ/DHR/GLGF domain-containing protein n=1 Tax=Desulfatibacillum aliphaticivorans TaxID=218208 RepID=B8FE37_DESAL|nr:type II secretion system protein GspC [Desulfatibacillum aliphaticivorans]ACL06818.1 PDZ/DHR/GLGF domain-containing protein [Desulfatibacillum aliphaticivorans]
MKKFAPIALNLLVITLVAYLAADAFYQVAESKVGAMPVVLAEVSPQASQAPQKTSPYSEYKRSVVQRDLFHTIKPKEPAVAPPPKPVEDIDLTSLKLSLLGTITGPEKYACAFIEDTKARSSDLYRIGDDVQGAQLRQIMRGKVVLHVNGRDELLVMDDDEKKARRRGPSSGPAPVQDSSGRDFKVGKEQINNALQNINQLMTQINVRPVFEDGKPAGLMLRRIKPNSIFKEMGLEDGDVIQGINDREIQDTEDILSLYQSLKNAEEVSLQIKRGGTPTSLNYSFE